MTTTDEILALAARRGNGQRAGADGMEVTEADVAAFRAAADRGQGSAVVRALLATRPGRRVAGAARRVPGPCRPPRRPASGLGRLGGGRRRGHRHGRRLRHREPARGR